MSSHCKVSGCRFPTTHLTRAHRCGRCGVFGHGLLECAHPTRRQRLRQESPSFYRGVFDCLVANCEEPWSHTTAAHHCPSCGVRGWMASNCCAASSNNVQGDDNPLISCPTCRTLSPIDEREVFGNGCVICFDAAAACVVFSACRHANVCKGCFVELRRHSEQ